jgi:ADP-heptose:LPS heptosyltransferase
VEIDVLAESRNQAAFSFLKTSHCVELYTDLGAFFRLRKKRYDVIIDTEQWYRLSVVYARLLKPARLIGFATNERARLLTDKVKYSLDDYELDSFFRLLEPLGLVASQSDKRLGIALGQKTIEQTRGLLGNADVDRWVAVFPGASLAEKRWPTENYCKIVKGLQGKGLGVVIVGGESECEVAGIIEAETGCTNLSGKTSFTETGGVLSNMDLLISGDSALLHLAASLEVPTVSLFGPSNPQKWSPQGEQHRFLQKEFECVPCSRYGHIPPCPHNVKCLNSLAPEDVLDAALELLEI